MASPFVGEIRAVGFNFAPTGWATCDGQLLPISQNTALFSLLGTFYGGDGKSTFALPNLQASTPVGTGQGPASSHDHTLGEAAGTPYVTLQPQEMPLHTHTMQAASDAAELQAPGPDRALARSSPGQAYTSNTTNAALDPAAVSVTGGGLPHNNMAPALVVNFVIAMQGVFPQRP
jgi:microcystin-dependent protein